MFELFWKLKYLKNINFCGIKYIFELKFILLKNTGNLDYF